MNGSTGNSTRWPSGSVMVCDARSTLIFGVFREREELRVNVVRHHDRQQRILQRVAFEDVGERGADHGAEAELRERPRRVLARTAAAEVIAGEQDLRRPVPRGVFRMKSGFRIALRVIAPVAEELLVEAFLRRGLQKAGGDDLVRVDVVVRASARGAIRKGERVSQDGPHVSDDAGEGAGGGGQGRGEEGASAFALTAFEIAVAGRDAVLAGLS